MTSRNGFSRGWGAACGLVAAAAAMGIGQLFAGFTVPAASPVVAVGEAAIDRTPLAVKDWATSTFGTSDKTVLLAGVLVVVFLYSMLVGVLAMRRLALGFLGLAIFAGIGLAAALTRHGASASYAVPTLFGAAAGGLMLWWLVVRARQAVTAGAAGRAARASSGAGHDADRLPPIAFGQGDRDPEGSGGGRPGWPGRDDDVGWVAAGGGAPAGSGRPGEGRPGEGRPGDGDNGSRDGASRGGAYQGGAYRGGGRERLPGWTPAGRAGPTARRQFLLAAGTGLAAAAVGELGGRSLATRKNVSLAQAAIRFPRASVPAPPLPAGVNLPVPGISPFITPNGQFYRVDTALLVPQVDPSNWQLRIHGMVSREMVITFDELLRRPLIEDYVTLCCVSNPVGGPYIGNAKWLGASYGSLHQVAAGPKARRGPAAVHLGRRVHRGHAAGGGARRSARLAHRRRHERRRAADRPRVPRPPRRTRPVRVRVGVQVGGRHRGHHVRGGAGILGAARLVAARPDQDRVPDRRAGQRVVGESGPGGRRRRGMGTAQGHRGRRGTRQRRAVAPGHPGDRARTSTPGGSGPGSGTPPRGRT